MAIKNEEELLAAIDKILPSVESKKDNNPQASMYLDVFKKLIKIKELVDLGDFTVKAKQECDMSGPIVSLYGDVTKEMGLSKQAEFICTINNYYQGAHIATLDKKQAKEFFIKKGL